MGARAKLSLELWKSTKDQYYKEVLRKCAANTLSQSQPWRDAPALMQIIEDLGLGQAGDLTDASQIALEVEEHLTELLGHPMSFEDLDSIYGDLENADELLSPNVRQSLITNINDEIANLPLNLMDEDSVSSLEDQIEMAQALAAKAGTLATDLEAAISALSSRIEEISEYAQPEDPPSSYNSSKNLEIDKFDDDELWSLFAPLLADANQLA